MSSAPPPDESRLDPLPPYHAPELKEEFASFLQTLGFVPNSVLTMQRNPGLVRGFVAMQRAIWDPKGKVDRGLKRLVAHLASRASDDSYSMAHTASGALHFGVGADKLDALPDYRSSPLYSDAEKAALDLAAAMSSNLDTGAVFAGARRHWSEEEMVEIVATVAMAGFLSRWNKTMATPLEDEPMEVGKTHLARHGWSPGVHRR